MVDTKGLDDELIARLKALTRDLPADSEVRRILLNLDIPANDEPSKDRYVALVAGGAVDEGLKVALARHLSVDASDSLFEKKLGAFKQRILKAGSVGIVSPEEVEELHRIRHIRNAFAHALTPISFSTPEVTELTKKLWHHPVTRWSGYFAPVFAPRARFGIVCSEFYNNLVRNQPMAARGVKTV